MPQYPPWKRSILGFKEKIRYMARYTYTVRYKRRQIFNVKLGLLPPRNQKCIAIISAFFGTVYNQFKLSITVNEKKSLLLHLNLELYSWQKNTEASYQNESSDSVSRKRLNEFKNAFKTK